MNTTSLSEAGRAAPLDQPDQELGYRLIGVEPERSDLFFEDLIRYVGSSATISFMDGAARNQLYKIEPHGPYRRPPMVAKFYNPNSSRPPSIALPEAGSDMFCEFHSLRFLRNQGFDNVPQPYHCNYAGRFALYAFIEGQHKTAAELTEDDALAMVDFMYDLQQFKPDEVKLHLPSFQTPRYGLDDYFAAAIRRLTRASTVLPFLPSEAVSSAQEVVSGMESLMSCASQSLDKATPAGKKQLTPSELRLCPLDIAPHNMLFDVEDKPYFIDLEKTSWQDPAYQIAYFYTHNRFWDAAPAVRETAWKRIVERLDRRHVGRLETVGWCVHIEWIGRLLDSITPQRLADRRKASLDFDERAFTAQVLEACGRRMRKAYEMFPFIVD